MSRDEVSVEEEGEVQMRLETAVVEDADEKEEEKEMKRKSC